MRVDTEKVLLEVGNRMEFGGATSSKEPGEHCFAAETMNTLNLKFESMKINKYQMSNAIKC